MKRQALLLLVLSASAFSFAVGACAKGSEGDGSLGGGGASSGEPSGSGAFGSGDGGSGATAAGPGSGAGSSSSSSSGTSAGPSGSGGGGGSSSSGGGPLDPDLELPDPSGDPCDTPGQQCGGGLGLCRISSSDGGTCESCDACGNLFASCTTNKDCDTLFQCFQGKCTNICPLGSTYCGPPEDCIDVGHETYGVCAP